jgi:polyhydroxyalkanoate synthesis regulator phasin
MIFSSGLLVFGQDSGLEIDNMKSAVLVRRETTQELAGHKKIGLKAVIDKLVEEGKLSREKADQIDKFIKQKRDEQEHQNNTDQQSFKKGFKYGMINDLVNAKIISANEAEMIRSKFGEIKEQAFNEKLNVLVQKGTITKEQADKVQVYFKKARLEKAEQYKKVQNMTEEQRKAFFKEHKKDGLMTKLIEDGILTQEQVNELKNAMREGHKNKCKDH